MAPENVLAIRDVRKLQELSALHFAGCSPTDEEIRHIFELCGALWLHGGDRSRPHIELTSGKCSDGFVDVLRVLRYTNLCELFARQLLKVVWDNCQSKIDWVVGSDHASAALTHSMATILGCQHDFTEKGPDKTQLWKRFAIQPNEIVLLAEELITTSGTVCAVRDGIRNGNPFPVSFAPIIAVLVHRSDVYEVDGKKVVYIVHYDINVWDPEECPLCKSGSNRLKPKQHWAELTGSVC